jgi:hypothetical protein
MQHRVGLVVGVGGCGRVAGVTLLITILFTWSALLATIASHWRIIVALLVPTLANVAVKKVFGWVREGCASACGSAPPPPPTPPPMHPALTMARAACGEHSRYTVLTSDLGPLGDRVRHRRCYMVYDVVQVR